MHDRLSLFQLSLSVHPYRSLSTFVIVPNSTAVRSYNHQIVPIIRTYTCILSKFRWLKFFTRKVVAHVITNNNNTQLLLADLCTRSSTCTRVNSSTHNRLWLRTHARAFAVVYAVPLSTAVRSHQEWLARMIGPCKRLPPLVPRGRRFLLAHTPPRLYRLLPFLH